MSVTKILGFISLDSLIFIYWRVWKESWDENKTGWG